MNNYSLPFLHKMSRLKGSIVVSVLSVLFIFFIIYYLKEYLIKSKYLPQIEYNKQLWEKTDSTVGAPSKKQQMINDILHRIIDQDKTEIERILGKSGTHEDWRIRTKEDREKESQLNSKGVKNVLIRTGKGFYYQQLQWDMIYRIGSEHFFIFNHRGQILSPEPEILIIRLDKNNNFSSWYITGSYRWKNIVDADLLDKYSEKRIEPGPEIPRQ